MIRRLVPSPFRSTARCIVVSLVAVAGLCCTAQAQEAAPGGQDNPQQRMRAIAAKLQKAEEAALADNPDLADRRDAYQALLRDTMIEKGADPESSMKRLEEIRTEAQSGNVPAGEREALAKEFQQTRQSLVAARQAAMQDEEVAAARKAFREDLLTAMNEQNPDTPALIRELQRIRQAMQARFMDQRGGQR